jgi:hypothetical protein
VPLATIGVSGTPDARNREQIRFRPRHLTEEENMTTRPRCPQSQNFSIVTGFLTPGSDTGPGALDGSISLDVLDPTENNERVRAVEVSDPWRLEVDWCICGRFADLVGGCWCVQVFIDDIDGVGPTHGPLGSKKVAVDTGTTAEEGEDTSTRCFTTTFDFPAGSVGAGVYDLVVLITLSNADCDDKGRLVQDMVGWAEVPVLVFFDENAPFCPPVRR